jgi:hypothetical protein
MTDLEWFQLQKTGRTLEYFLVLTCLPKPKGPLGLFTAQENLLKAIKHCRPFLERTNEHTTKLSVRQSYSTVAKRKSETEG